MVTRPEDLNLPATVVTKLVKDSLPDHVNVSKEARVAIGRAASVFVLYTTACANNIAASEKRKTISPEDILSAMKDMEMEQFVNPLRKCLEAYRKNPSNPAAVRGKSTTAKKPRVDKTTSKATTVKKPATDTSSSTKAQNVAQSEKKALNEERKAPLNSSPCLRAHEHGDLDSSSSSSEESSAESESVRVRRPDAVHGFEMGNGHTSTESGSHFVVENNEEDEYEDSSD